MGQRWCTDIIRRGWVVWLGGLLGGWSCGLAFSGTRMCFLTLLVQVRQAVSFAFASEVIKYSNAPSSPQYVTNLLLLLLASLASRPACSCVFCLSLHSKSSFRMHNISETPSHMYIFAFVTSPDCLLPPTTRQVVFVLEMQIHSLWKMAIRLYCLHFTGNFSIAPFKHFSRFGMGSVCCIRSGGNSIFLSHN